MSCDQSEENLTITHNTSLLLLTISTWNPAFISCILLLVSDKIVETNPDKFQVRISRPGEMEARRRRRRTGGLARIHIDGMTCNKCVNFIQSKVGLTSSSKLLHTSRLDEGEAGRDRHHGQPGGEGGESAVRPGGDELPGGSRGHHCRG